MSREKIFFDIMPLANNVPRGVMDYPGPNNILTIVT
jgi:hypothetical protein